MSKQIEEVDDSDTIVLHARPIALTKRISFLRGPGGIPILREVIVIETEASLSRILSILITGFVYALIFQMFICIWQKYHKKSCEVVISTLLFLFPPLLLLYMRDNVSFALCVMFDLILLKAFLNTLRKPMRKETPKNTYILFKYIYRTTYVGSIFMQALVFFGFMLSKQLVLAIGLTLLGFCIYFGLLLRESINLIYENMAINTGYYSKDGAPNKQINNELCAICDEVSITNSIKLKCGHKYHRDCLMGWVFMGKKNFCMVCRENVDFSRIDVDLWQKGENFFSSMIDMLRKGIVFVAFFYALSIVSKYRK